MKIFSFGKDGGPDSCVWGFWLIEAKKFFSIALLVFEDGSRESFHSHAFNSVSWILNGSLIENIMINLKCHKFIRYERSFKPVITKRETFHKVTSLGRTWVLTFRGPWAKQWKEFDPATKEFITLESGRKIVDATK